MRTSRTLAATALAGFALALAVPLTASATVAPTPSPPQTSVAPPTEEQLAVAAILEDTNKLRLAAGLPPLQLSAALSSVADTWAEKLQDSFEHNPDLFEQIPAGWAHAGENIAYASYGDGHTMVTLWANSPGHMANMVNTRYDYIGIGWFTGPTGVHYAVQEFGLYGESPDPAVTPTPTGEPTPEPTPDPTGEPTPEPTPGSTAEPAPDPSPTDEPSGEPTASPSPTSSGSGTPPASPVPATANGDLEPEPSEVPTVVTPSPEGVLVEEETPIVEMQDVTSPSAPAGGVAPATEGVTPDDIAAETSGSSTSFAPFGVIIGIGGLLAAALITIAAVPAWRARFLKLFNIG